MTANRIVYCVFFFIVFSFSAVPQEKPKALPLKQILREIGNRHNISFSYIEDDLAVFSLMPPEPTASLKKKLDYIEKETRLKIRSSDGLYYTVVADAKLKKILCGFLLDSDTGIPVENAALSIASVQFTTSSDGKGYFEIPRISSDSIQIRHQGYRPMSLRPADLLSSECIDISLNPIARSLDEVVTQRILTTGISKGRSGNFKIRPAEFGILPGLTEPDVLQTMQQIPGIYSADETISNINVRGGTHDQNLFLWNGIRMFQTGHFFGLISGFNPSLAQSITIIKNGSSAFYGESVSSVVDISSQATHGQKDLTSISANSINAEAHAFVELTSNSSITVSARRSFTDLFESPAYHSYSERIFQNTVITNFGNGNEGISTEEDFYFYDFTAQYRQRLGRHIVNADFIGISNALSAQQTDGDETRRDELRQHNIGGNVAVSSRWTDRLSTAGSFYVSSYVLDGISGSLTSGLELDQKNEVFDTGIRVRSDYGLSDNVHLAAGYQFNETGVTSFDKINVPPFTRTITELIRSHAIIGEATYESTGNRVFLRGGFRLNYYDKLARFLAEPRIQFSYKINGDWQLEILGERKSQSLSQVIDRQQDFLGIEKRRWIIANNDNVPLQVSTQGSIGFTYKHSGWLVSVESFLKNVEGITTSSQGFQYEFQTARTDGSYNIVGSEVLVQKQFWRLHTWLSYSYNDNGYTFGQLIPSEFDNSYEIVHSISWAAIYEWEGLKIALGSKWHTGRPFTRAIESGGTAFFETANAERLSNYFQANFSASKQWRVSEKVQFEAGISILNILNNRNVINRYFRIEDNSAIQIDTYSLKRTPNVNIRLSF